MLLSISQYGDAVLRSKSAPVEHVDKELENLVANMMETMYAANGIGLAAPQIGLNIRLVVIDIPKEEEEEDADEMITLNGEQVSMYSLMPLVFINPELEPYGEQSYCMEGCLSVHELRANVARLSRVRARLQKLDGTVMEIDCGGLLARCLQHEVDHLEGFLFTDRVSSASRLTINKKLKRLASYRS